LVGRYSILYPNKITPFFFIRPYYSSLGLVCAHVAHQITTLQIDNPEDCGQKFVSNSRVGLVLFLGIALGTLYKDKNDEKETLEPSKAI